VNDRGSAVRVGERDNATVAECGFDRNLALARRDIGRREIEARVKKRS
jgi:hypothetical protein